MINIYDTDVLMYVNQIELVWGDAFKFSLHFAYLFSIGFDLLMIRYFGYDKEEQMWNEILGWLTVESPYDHQSTMWHDIQCIQHNKMDFFLYIHN